jgi:uracil-DNA glycosylase family 4
MAQGKPSRVQQAATAVSLERLNARVVACERCPRLRDYCAEVARVRRRAYRDHEYWGRPVPSFGDTQARILLVGLAPGAHGSNRTGRPFTGDGSGNFMYPILYDAGLASQPNAVSREDGMQLHSLRINSVVRCAPPGNKPLPAELRNCSPYLDEEMALLPELRVIVCLGKIAFDGVLAHLVRTGRLRNRAGHPFAHGAEFSVDSGRESVAWHVLASYHPSLQNTNTGKLTPAMMLRVFHRARELAGME